MCLFKAPGIITAQALRVRLPLLRGFHRRRIAPKIVESSHQLTRHAAWAEAKPLRWQEKPRFLRGVEEVRTKRGVFFSFGKKKWNKKEIWLFFGEKVGAMSIRKR